MPMGLFSRIPGADRVNVVNIGLMLFSCAVALAIPFELFLFSYAVLGPAHYLTEISWLEKRGFFTRGRHDYLLLGLPAVLVFVSAPPAAQAYTFNMALYTAVALGSALVLVLADKAKPRLIGLLAVFGIAFGLLKAFGFLAVLMALFVPTLIHVYVFTGFFMIFGALKERSLSGYAAFAVFLACPLVCWLVPPIRFDLSPYVVVSYWKGFSLLNLTMLGIDVPQGRADGGAAGLAVFESATGLVVMRFIAFAYTYHYLNWFSKTSIIRWHEVGTRRLAAIAALWMGSVALYVYDYALSVRVLLWLSLLHVYLEFPLNHISIMGTGREVRSRFRQGTRVGLKPSAG
jgi:hypothetical protein